MDYTLGIAYTDETASQYAHIGSETFGVLFTLARQQHENIHASTSPFDWEQADRGREDRTYYRISLDGRSGYAIRDEELVYVFSLERGRGDDLVADAVRQGARRLDCFDSGHLTSLYARHGFAETGREANWDPEGPDVVFMTYQM